MHYDALLSNYGRGKSSVKYINWVIVCLCVQTPWNKDRYMAIPIALRLYRSKKHCPKRQYRNSTDARLINLLQFMSIGKCEHGQ